MNLFLYEIKANLKSTFIWLAGIIAYVLLALSLFPSFMKDAEQFIQLLASLPQELLSAFGVQLESFVTILGYYSYTFTYVLLLGAIQAMNLGLNTISKEIRKKTADFLLVKPISRLEIMYAKLSSSLVLLLCTNIVYVLFSSLFVSYVAEGEYSGQSLWLINLSLFLVQMFFFALGVLLSILLPKIRSVLPISLGIVFAFFIVGLFTSATGDDALRYATPFKYFDAHYIIQNASYESSYLIVTISFVVLAIIASIVIFRRKDIHAN